jgi:hypothetical protein
VSLTEAVHAFEEALALLRAKLAATYKRCDSDVAKGYEFPNM